MFCRTSKTIFYFRGSKEKNQLKLKRLLIMTIEKEFKIERSSWAKTARISSVTPKSKTGKGDS
jgi:hypothetical protein